MIDRYTRPEMGALWTDEVKIQQWLAVELSVCEAWARRGRIPAEAMASIRGATCNLERMREIERETDHDVIAFLRAVGETVGEASRYIHLGLTSSDVVDTGLGIQARNAGHLLMNGLDHMIEVVGARAIEHKRTLTIGRSHGMHAEPMTFGLKLAVWYDELRRHRVRLELAIQDIAVGQISGAVGTHAHIPPDLEAEVCADLGLGVELASNQVVQRDRHAFFLAVLAGVAGTMEKVTVEIRHLQRTEVGEAEEFFGEGNQGSSAMPHKRNPHQSERIAGLARLVRGYAQTGFENVPLWHERDISHSSAERIIFPDSCILLDYMLAETTELVEELVVYPARMLANLESTGGLIYSQRIMLALVDAGIDRQVAYKLIQRHAHAAWDEGQTFRDVIAADPLVLKHLSPGQLDELFDPWQQLQHLDASFERLGLLETADVRAATVNPCAAVTTIEGLPYPPYRRGKVRDVFDLGDRLLIVATDRLSAFDVVLPTAIPGKGALLTAISDFWFDHIGHILPNHRTSQSLDDLGVSPEQQAQLAGRSTIVRKAERIDIECVVRGHLAGSGWKEYQATGTLAGEPLPTGLQRGDELPDLRFTPAVKNDDGHDESISRDRLAELIGRDLAIRLERTSVDLFTTARSIAAQAGFVLADTKFEFGFIDGELTLIDEALTPESSRYWDIATWSPGTEPPSFDKQAVRDWLETSGWNKESPGPELPADIVASTREKYAEVLRRLTAIEQKEPRP